MLLAVFLFYVTAYVSYDLKIFGIDGPFIWPAECRAFVKERLKMDSSECFQMEMPSMYDVEIEEW